MNIYEATCIYTKLQVYIPSYSYFDFRYNYEQWYILGIGGGGVTVLDISFFSNLQHNKCNTSNIIKNSTKHLFLKCFTFKSTPSKELPYFIYILINMFAWFRQCVFLVCGPWDASLALKIWSSFSSCIYCFIN